MLGEYWSGVPWKLRSPIALMLCVFALMVLPACGSSNSTTSFPATVALTSPTSGTEYTDADDVDATAAGIQINVTATTTGSKEGAEFTLYLDPVTDCDGTVLGTASVDANQNLAFDGVTLPDGGHALQICSIDGRTKSEKVAVTVTPTVVANCPDVTFVVPAPNGTTPVTLGAADDTDGEACGATFTTTVEVSTNAANGSNATLYVNASSRGSTTVQAASARFDAVVLDNRGDTANTIEVETVAADGHTCRTPFPANVMVDCAGVSCSITKPSPSTSFLNTTNDTSTDAGFQMDVEVSTDAEAVGQDVTLVVDADVGGAASAPVTSQNAAGIATFGNVALSEGVHRFQAICTDSAGNVTYSGIVQWTVDITPCTIAISDIASGSNPITDLDDSDATAAGIQVPATGTVTGTSCTGFRVGPCSGLPTDFTSLNTSDWSDTITLGSAASQDVCAEVQDDAGNVGQVQQSVTVRTDFPQVEIVTPADGTGFNSNGTNNRTQDLNNATANCDVAFTVNCSDVGVDVVLMNQGTGATLGTATCTAMTGLPAPYNGQATFASVALPSNNAGASLTVVAQQTVGALTGLSTPITLSSDCDKPFLQINIPTCGSTLRPSTDDSDLTTAGFQYNVVVLNGNTPKPDVTLTLADSAGNTVRTLNSSTPPTGNQTRFDNTDFGSGGQVTLTACATDAAGNIGCSVACSVLVADLPTLAISQPVDQAILSGTADCDTGTAGFQLRVTATTDAADGSAATVKVGTNTAVSTTVSGGTITMCTDAPEGVGVPVVVTVTDSRGSANATVSISIDTLPPTSAISDLSVTFNGVGRRSGQASFSWTAVGDSGGTTLAKYALRCAATPITDEGTWDAATVFPISVAPAAQGTPQSATVSGFRIATTMYCALRGVDNGNALTPLASPVSIPVAPDFLTQDVTDATGVQLGEDASGVGDVNGDGLNDVVIGSVNGPAYLYFGSSTGLSATPSVRIDGPTAGDFGRVVAGLGDINGDGAPDFAITARTSGTVAGSVYVFFGKKTNTWPPVVDVQTTCNAGLCFNGSLSNAALGWRVTSANFDGIAPNDLIITAFNSNAVGRVYVILGGAQLNLAAPANTFDLPGADLTTLPNGFVIDPPSGIVRYGTGVATPGDFIGADGAEDLVIGGSGNPVTPTLGAVTSVAGRKYPTSGAGLVTINSAEIAVIDSGAAGTLGNNLRAIGDFNGDGRIDLDVENGTTQGQPVLYFQGAAGFSASSKMTVTNDSTTPNGDLFGQTIGEGRHPGLGLIGDIDKDGFADLFVGSTQDGTSAGTCQLFFGRNSPTSTNRSTANKRFTATARCGASYIGDVNGDGYPDMALSDPAYGSNAGRLVIVY